MRARSRKFFAHVLMASWRIAAFETDAILTCPEREFLVADFITERQIDEFHVHAGFQHAFHGAFMNDARTEQIQLAQFQAVLADGDEIFIGHT